MGPLLYGNWVSGGGSKQFHGEPWYLQNSTDVYYCLNVSDNFGLTPQRANELFGEAIQFWREQLSGLKTFVAKGIGGEGDKGYRVATQKFHQVTCSDPKLQLTLYLGALPDPKLRKKYLPKSREYVAALVRTEFDQEQHRSKGFLFVHHDKWQEHDPWFERLAWSALEGKLLKQVFIHELGHLFGLQHEHPSFDTHIMSSTYLQSMLLSNTTSHIMHGPAMGGLYEWTMDKVILPFRDGSMLNKFFGIMKQQGPWVRYWQIDLYTKQVSLHSLSTPPRLVGKLSKMQIRKQHRPLIMIQKHNKGVISLPGGGHKPVQNHKWHYGQGKNTTHVFAKFISLQDRAINQNSSNIKLRLSGAGQIELTYEYQGKWYMEQFQQRQGVFGFL